MQTSNYLYENSITVIIRPTNCCENSGFENHDRKLLLDEPYPIYFKHL